MKNHVHNYVGPCYTPSPSFIQIGLVVFFYVFTRIVCSFHQEMAETISSVPKRERQWGSKS